MIKKKAEKKKELKINVTGYEKKGKVSELYLCLVRGKKEIKRCKIVSVSNGAEIKTARCSPGCHWVFWGGKWWYVC